MTRSVSLCLLALALVAGCGGDAAEDPLPTPDAALPTPLPEETPETSASPAATPAVPAADQKELERLDRSKAEANVSVEQAAKEGDKSALRAAERRLDRASRKARKSRPSSTGDTSADPLTQLLATFPYKEAPLFVQQTTRSAAADDHQLLASVLRGQFCLKSRRQRLAAVRDVFELGDGYLRKRGATDFELIVVPLTPTAPKGSDALATAGESGVRLTKKGRECEG